MANAFRINTNIQAQQAFQNLQDTNEALAEARQRLTTGKRINSAADDAAGFSIANRLEGKIGGQEQALRNIGDAKSTLSTAEGALDSQLNILQTVREKATQAANESLSQSERDAIANELSSLKSEVNDIASNATFNGKQLIKGGSAGADGNSTRLDFQTGSESDDTFSVKLKNSTAQDLSIGGKVDATKDENKSVGQKDFSSGELTLDSNKSAIAVSSGSTGNEAATTGGQLRNIDGAKTFNIKVTENDDGSDSKLTFTVDGGSSNGGTTVTTAVNAANSISLGTANSGISLSDASKVVSGTGAVAQGESKEFTVTVKETNDIGKRLNGGSAQVARNIIDDAKSAISTLTDQLSDIGASQNRLSFKENNLETAKTNLSEARSRIEDANLAREQTKVAKLQVRQQTGTAQLAQANAAGQSVLSLLGG